MPPYRQVGARRVLDPQPHGVVQQGGRHLGNSITPGEVLAKAAGNRRCARGRKVPRGLKPRGFPDDPSLRFRGGIQARVSSSGVLTCRLCRVSRRGCVVSILRSPRLVSWGSSPGVPDPWYWLTFYAGSLPVPATAYVRRLDRTGNGPIIKDRLFLSTFVARLPPLPLKGRGIRRDSLVRVF